MLKLRNKRVLFKVVSMVNRRAYILILLLLIGCQQGGSGAEQAAKVALPANGNTAEVKIDKQLEINRNALLNGPSEKNRVDAATLLLSDEKPAARKILLDVLAQSENKAAQKAICKALSQSDTVKKVTEREDFIEPLFGMLAEEDLSVARPAAEAILIFDYDQISGPLEKMLAEPSLSVKSKSNAIYLLEVWPDKRAIFKLMDLLEASDKKMAAEAEKTLRALGIPVGKDVNARKEIREELERKSKDEFLRDWQVRREQEERMHRLRQELDWWQKQHLRGLEKLYGLSDEKSQVSILAESLGSPKAQVKLWSLEKIEQRRKGTSSKLPGELGEILIGLVSDSSRDVRLKTAGLLSFIVELNSAEKLLGQMKIEQDDEVRMELFSALGGACHYAMMPDSPVKIPAGVRKETLEFSVEYLSSTDTGKVRKAAEVIGKLLERDGLTEAEVDRYLVSLADRYKQEQNSAADTLRGELLNVMASLCAQSVYKAKSASLFGGLFEGGLIDTSPFVRQAAVDGLIYIDKTQALSRFRKELALVNDSDAKIRGRIIGLAGEVGDKEDLLWLAEKTGTSAEGESAWQAMLKIFRLKSCDGAILNEWVGKFSSQNSKFKLTNDQLISLLEITERKAVSDKNPAMLKEVRRRLIEIYKKNGNFEKAAEYLGLIRKTVSDAKQKQAITIEQLEVYLRGGNIKTASHLLENYLLENDLEPNSVILSIDNYLGGLSAEAERKAVLDAFVKIKAPASKEENWRKQLNIWRKRFGHIEEPNSPDEVKK